MTRIALASKWYRREYKVRLHYGRRDMIERRDIVTGLRSKQYDKQESQLFSIAERFVRQRALRPNGFQVR